MKKTIFFLSFGLLQGCFLTKAPSTPMEKLESYYNNLHKLNVPSLLKENFSIKFHKIKDMIEKEECIGVDERMKDYHVKIGFLRFLFNQGYKIQKDIMKEHLLSRKRGRDKLKELLRYKAGKLREKENLLREYDIAEKNKIVKIFKALKARLNLEKVRMDDIFGIVFSECLLSELMRVSDDIFTKNANTFQKSVILEEEILNFDDDSSVEDIDSDISEDDWRIDIYEDAEEEKEYKKFFETSEDPGRTFKRFKEEESKEEEPKIKLPVIQNDNSQKNAENEKFQRGERKYLEFTLEEKTRYLKEIIEEFNEKINDELKTLTEEELKNITTTLEKENYEDKASLEDMYYKKKELEKRLQDVEYLVNNRDSKIFFHINREKEFKDSIDNIKNILQSLKDDLLNDRKKLRFLELQQKFSSLSLKTTENQ